MSVTAAHFHAQVVEISATPDGPSVASKTGPATSQASSGGLHATAQAIHDVKQLEATTIKSHPAAATESKFQGRLAAGQSIQSPDGKYTLVMQADGNLVEYAPGGQPIFATETSGNNYAFMQADGNLVVYRNNRTPLWATDTDGNGHASLTLDDRGYLDIAQAKTGKTLWRGNFRMLPGQTLTPTTPQIFSKNGQYKLTMQADGNLVEYRPDGEVLFSPNVFGRGNRAVMQRDGNLVVYNSQGRPLWASDTAGYNGAFLQLRNDGRLLLLNDSHVIWAGYDWPPPYYLTQV